MDLDRIAKMRRLGQTTRTSSGAEAVRITAQFRGTCGSQSREVWRSTLQGWEQEIGRRLSLHGGELVKGSLSVTGQTVEAVVPVACLPALLDEMRRVDVRLDLATPQRMDGL